MFARNFTVRFRPALKSNFVLLPETYKRMVSTCKTGCLLLGFTDAKSGQYKSVYVSWANLITATNPFEAEDLGVNPIVAEGWGLQEGTSVSCSMISTAQPLKSLSITLSGDDFAMAECSTERIQYDLLDQLTVVGRYQSIVIFLNKSISLKAVVDNLSPSFNYGRIQNDTEISINRKMTPDFMRPKTSAVSDSDARMKRMSAIERSETMDLSRLRRNNSFIDSRNYLDPQDVSNIRRQSNGWSDSIADAKKPPLSSPRGSLRRASRGDSISNGYGDKIGGYSERTSGYLDKNGGYGEKTSNYGEKVNPLSVSSSLSSIRRMQDEAREKEMNPISNSLSASNIKRVQEKSKQFLETLSSKEKSPKAQQLMTSMSTSSVPKAVMPAEPAVFVEKKQNHRQVLEDLKRSLAREAQVKNFMNVKIEKKLSKFAQVNEIFVTKSSKINFNQIHKIRTKEDKEYHVRVKINDQLSNETIEIHPVLAKILGIETSGEKVEVFETKLVCNCIEGVELIPLADIAEAGLGHQIAKDMEEKFKKYVNANSRILPLILNQSQIFRIDDYLVTVKLFPLSTPACCIDSEILRENIIEIARIGEANEFAPLMQEDKKKKRKKDENSNILKLAKHEKIIESAVCGLHPSSNRFRVLGSEQNNFIIAGASKSGKTNICNEIQKRLELRDVDVTVFNCAQYKGRKVDSIVKDMKSMLMTCLQTAPSVYVVFNLDALAAQSHEEQQTQEGEYLQKLTNGIRHLLEEFTHDYGDFVSVLVTVSKLSNLNKILYKSFGYYLFKNIVKIPNLEADDRRDLFKKLFQTSSDVKIDKNLDLEKFVRITEGYHIGDICQFADRAIFFAIKENFKSPTLSDEILSKSLAISNQHCLEGIRTENVDDEQHLDLTEKIPGMDNVIATLEEVLIWPAKFPKIFSNSPLRNQAGILLFGAPGTGKGFVVSQITRRWNLRLISIKGPELLAKYIGQSEENVRNLFEKAKNAKPCVLFFDEFDSLAPRRGHDSTGVTDRVVNQLLTELDGVKSLEGVSVICATSRPDLIDPALLRSGRIDRLVECQLPNANDRLEILKWLTKSLTVEPQIDLKALAIQLDNFSGADIKSVLTTANMSAIEEEIKKSDGKTVLEDIVIRKSHLLSALTNTRPSLTRQDIERYQTLYDKFKNKKSVTTETPKKVSLA